MRSWFTHTLPPPPDQHVKVFFALLPEPDATARAQRIVTQHIADRRMQARPLASDRLHLTLFPVCRFMGPVPDAILNTVIGAAASLRATPFEVSLDRAGSFPRRTDNRPYVLLGGDGVADLMHFYCRLGGALVRAGFSMGGGRSFRPHVTLAYSSRHHAEIPVPPVSWIAREFFLIESWQKRTHYRLLGRWPLQELASTCPAAPFPSPA